MNNPSKQDEEQAWKALHLEAPSPCETGEGPSHNHHDHIECNKYGIKSREDALCWPVKAFTRG